jgi:hypothetical protein
MHRPKFIFQFQIVVLVMCLSLLLLFFAVFHPLSDRTLAMDVNLTSLWNKLVEVNLRNNFRAGMDLRGVTESQIAAEKAFSSALKAMDKVRERVDLEPEYRERMGQTFSVIEFDQKRQEILIQIQTVAANKGVTLSPSVLAGFPVADVVGIREKPGQLWAQLAYLHYLLITASNFGTSTVKTVQLLDPRFHTGWNGAPGTWDEFPMRIEIQGSTEAIFKFIASVPIWGDDLKEQEGGFSAPHKPILFLDRILIKSVPGDPNSTSLDAVICGFFNREKPS